MKSLIAFQHIVDELQLKKKNRKVLFGCKSLGSQASVPVS